MCIVFQPNKSSSQLIADIDIRGDSLIELISDTRYTIYDTHTLVKRSHSDEHWGVFSIY